MRESDECWLTHFNGGRPVRVKRSGPYTFRVEDTTDGGPAVEIEAEWARPSTDPPLSNPAYVTDYDAELWEGHCVLLKCKGKSETYVAVSGSGAVEVTLDAENGEVLAFPRILSAVAANDVWYPILVTNRTTILLADHMRTGPAVRLLDDADRVTRLDVEARLDGGPNVVDVFHDLWTCDPDATWRLYSDCGIELLNED